MTMEKSLEPTQPRRDSKVDEAKRGTAYAAPCQPIWDPLSGGTYPGLPRPGGEAGGGGRLGQGRVALTTRTYVDRPRPPRLIDELTALAACGQRRGDGLGTFPRQRNRKGGGSDNRAALPEKICFTLIAELSET
jgi:hypothetical protein